jgi:hypothetical protein
MTRTTTGPSARSIDAAKRRWTAVTYDDTLGIDRDIDTLLRSVQKTHGISRRQASVELVRQLSLSVLQRNPQRVARVTS